MRWILIGTVLIGTRSAALPSESPASEATVREAIELTDLRGLTDSLASAADHASKVLRAAGSENAARAVSASFPEDLLFDLASARFRERARGEGARLETALAFLRSPLGKRVGRSSGGEDDESGAASARSETMRRETIARIDEATGTSRVALAMQMSLLGALAANQPEGAERHRSELARKTRARVRSALERLYLEVPQRELSLYLDYLHSPEGRLLSALAYDAVLFAIDSCARALEVRLVRRELEAC